LFLLIASADRSMTHTQQGGTTRRDSYLYQSSCRHPGSLPLLIIARKKAERIRIAGKELICVEQYQICYPGRLYLAGETLSDPFWGKEFNRYRELDIMEVFEAGTVTKM
jgi:hypothetical protein